MIPGPTMCDPAVLRALAAPVLSHGSPQFIETFGRALEGLRVLLGAKESQPVVVAGSGTLAMELAAASLIESSDAVLALSTGVFSDRFEAICQRYGATVTKLKAEVGDTLPLDKIEAALRQTRFKFLTVTHVDTSTDVQMDIAALTRLAARYGVLVVVDGICAAGGIEVRCDEWGVDVYVTASQKALGVPPGLALATFSPRALAAIEKRKAPVASYFCDVMNWLPIMRAYEARQPSYFATPPTNMIVALEASLQQILAEGLEARYRRHERLSRAFKGAVTAIGLKQVPLRPEIAAHTLTAAYYPEGVDKSLLGQIAARGVVVSTGIYPPIRDRYFRVGHMGVVNAGDILTTIGAIEGALVAAEYEFEVGAGVAAVQRELAGT